MLKGKSLPNGFNPRKRTREGRLTASIAVKHFLHVLARISTQVFASATCVSDIVKHLSETQRSSGTIELSETSVWHGNREIQDLQPDGYPLLFSVCERHRYAKL